VNWNFEILIPDTLTGLVNNKYMIEDWVDLLLKFKKFY